MFILYVIGIISMLVVFIGALAAPLFLAYYLFSSWKFWSGGYRRSSLSEENSCTSISV